MGEPGEYESFSIWWKTCFGGILLLEEWSASIYGLDGSKPLNDTDFMKKYNCQREKIKFFKDKFLVLLRYPLSTLSAIMEYKLSKDKYKIYSNSTIRKLDYEYSIKAIRKNLTDEQKKTLHDYFGSSRREENIVLAYLFLPKDFEALEKNKLSNW